jgi:hypothetical protein
MKKVYLILLWIWLANWAFAQQPFIFQGNYSSGQHTINQSNIETGSTGITHVGGKAQVDLRASGGIRLLPGFSAGGFINGGYFSARITPGGGRRDTTICQGQQITIGDSAEINVTYHWFPSIGLNDTSVAMPFASPDTTTSYVVEKRYSNGTFAIDTFVVVVNPLPIANAGLDTIIESGMELSLGQQPFPGVNYSWNSNDMLSDSSISNPIITGLNQYPFERSFIKVLTAEINGCISIDSITIKVLPAPNYYRFNEGFCNTENKLIYGMSKMVRNVPNPLPSNSYIICGNGKFRVTFQDIIAGSHFGFADPILGITRQNCVCAVLDYVASVIDIPDNVGTIDPPIDLLFDQSYNGTTFTPPNYGNTNNPSTILAEAAPNFPITTEVGYLPGYLAQHIQTGVVPETGIYDAEIRVNFDPSNDFYYCNNDQIGDCQYDFFGAILHEITHGLGFISAVVPILATPTGPVTGVHSYLGPNIYTKFDEQFLYMFNGSGFDKVVDVSAFGTNGGLNTIVTSNPQGWLQNNNVWLDDTDLFQQKTNQPIPPANISHFLIDFRNRNSTSPGFTPNYVMNFFLDKHHRLKEYTLQDLRALKELGYTISANSTYFNNINNIPPFSTDLLMNSTNQNISGAGLFKNQTPPGGNINSFFSTANCHTVVVDLNAKTISDGIQTITLDIQDVENDPLSVYEAFPGSKGVYNIRGCGNGGNNSDQLSLNAARNVITFYPRPNFIGRAQFGFQLYDGHEKGSYIVISVDVAKDICFINSPDANEIIINGSFEEGSEIRLTTEPSRTVVDEIDAQGYYLESAIPFNPNFRTLSSSFLTMFDAKQANENWDLPIVRNSSQSCIFENSSCFGSCSSNPFPDPNSGGNRYNLLNLTNTLNRSFNLTLSEDIISCKKYFLEADLQLNSGQNSGGSIAFNFHNSSSGINYIYSGQGIPDYNYSLQFSLSNLTLNNWVHMSIPVEIPPNTPTSNFLMISGANINTPVNVFVDNVSLKEVNEITITPNGPTTFCQGGSVLLTSSLASPVQWYLNGTSIQGATNQTYMATASGNYTVRYGTGTCPQLISDPLQVTVNPNPIITGLTHIEDFSICEGETRTQTVQVQEPGTFTYQWMDGNTEIQGQIYASITLNAAGIYSVSVTNENGCSTTSQSLNLSVNPLPIISIQGLINSYCINSSSITLIGSPSDGTFSGDGVSGNIFSPTDAGIGDHAITYTYTDENECVGSATITTHVYGLPNANAGSDRAICIGESTQLGESSAGFTTYSWTIGNSTAFSTLANPSVSPTSTTTYTLTSTSTILGCSNSDNVIVTVHQLPVANAGSDVTICQNGSVQLSGSGGLNYSWSPSTGLSNSTISNPIASPTTATTYSLTVTDAYGCTSTNSDQVEVSINNLSATYTTEVNTEKPCELPASATLFPTGGTPPYSIQWPSGGNGLTETGLFSGSYPVVIEDASGCTFDLNVIINTCCFSRTFTGPVRFIDNMHSSSLGSAISENTIVISGNFIINNNFTFFNQQEVVLLEGARITLEGTQSDPVEFKVTDNSRLHGCGQMWESISADNSYEKISIIQNAIVEDAKNAIYCKKCNLNLNQAHLNKNYVHVTLENTNTFSAADYTFNPILNSTFTCNLNWANSAAANLLPPYSSNTSSYMAINAGKYTVVTIGDGTIGNKNIFKRSLFGVYSNTRGKLKVLTNEFSELGFGILHNGPSLFQADGNDFKQISGVGIYPYRGWDSNNTIEITNNTHSNGTGWAIVSYNNNRKKTKIIGNTIDCSNNNPGSGGGISVFETASNNQDLQIENNIISEAYSGIWLSNIQGRINISTLSSSAFVSNNTITHRKAVSDNNGLSGIYLQNCSRLVLQHNQIHAHDGNPEWWESGIRQDLGTTNFLLCNDVKDIGRGLLLLGDNTPLEVLGANEMGNNQTGIFINKIGQQGWSGFPWDNTWDASYTWGNSENFATVVYDNDPSPPAYNGNESPFFVQSSSLPYMTPTISNVTLGQGINNQLTDFVQFMQTSGSFLSCPSIFTSPSFMVSQENEYKSMAKMVLNDTIRSAARDINEKWMSKYGLYSLMENDSILQSDTTLKGFYDSCHVSNMGLLHRASVLLTQLPNGKTLADMADYADTLSTLTPVNNTEGNWLEVLNIVSGNVLDSTGIDSSESATLISIAELCPYLEGFGVYMARATLIEIDTLPNFAEFNECEASPMPPAELRREDNKNNENQSLGNNYKIYPNPNNGDFNLEYHSSDNEAVETTNFTIFDITGHLVFSRNISLINNMATIKANNLSNGSYLVKVTIKGETKLIARIILLK